MVRTDAMVVEKYMVMFDNGSTHFERELRDAREFAEKMQGVGWYGHSPVIYRRTTIAITTYEEV